MHFGGCGSIWFINSAYPLLGPFLPPVLFDLLYALSHNFHYLRVNHACPCPSLHAACQENNAKLYMLLEVNKICILCIVFLPGGRRKLRVNFQDHEDVISFWHSSVPHAVEQRISDRDALTEFISNLKGVEPRKYF